MNMIDAKDIETNEDIRQKLEDIEIQLAKREGISAGAISIREQLIDRLLIEDELVSKWLELLTTYNYWTKRDVESK